MSNESAYILSFFQGMMMPTQGAKNVIVNKQPVMNNNLMMGKMVPNGPLMQRAIRNQQPGGMAPAMVQRHQVAQVCSLTSQETSSTDRALYKIIKCQNDNSDLTTPSPSSYTELVPVSVI